MNKKTHKLKQKRNKLGIKWFKKTMIKGKPCNWVLSVQSAVWIKTDAFGTPNSKDKQLNLENIFILSFAIHLHVISSCPQAQ